MEKIKMKIWPFKIIAVKRSSVWLQSEDNIYTVQSCQPSCPWRCFTIDVYHCGHSRTQWLKNQCHKQPQNPLSKTHWNLQCLHVDHVFSNPVSFTTTIEVQFKLIFRSQCTENSCSPVYVCFKVFNDEISFSEEGLKSMDICLSW
jgi:hypothetical protein